MTKLTVNIRGYVGIGVVLAGTVAVALGVFFAIQGWSARNEVRAAMLEEAVTTEIDGVDVPVLDQRTATNQAELIKSHTTETFGPYTSLDRADPQRDTYLKGLTLRNSLYLARLSLDLSDLVMGLGALFAAIGISLTAIGALTVAQAVRIREPEAAPGLQQTAGASALT